jgi:hypothetical protein
MNAIELVQLQWQQNRERSLATLDEIAQMPSPEQVLAWRPGEGRAHIAWQLMHIGVTEELFATERLAGTSPSYPDLVPRFRGGSTPDDQIPSVDLIRDVLENSREHLNNTISTFVEADLPEIPQHFAERGWTFEKTLHIIAWHEPHHQGQAHLTFNLWKALQSQ